MFMMAQNRDLKLAPEAEVDNRPLLIYMAKIIMRANKTSL